MSETMSARRAVAPGYRPGRTLPLRVEAARQLRRRRTRWTFVLLLALPWILVGAFEIRGNSSSGGSAPTIIQLGNAGGLNFAAFTLFVSAGFLMVVAVALFCGDTVASEAGWASLRYLLAAPVPRARLLHQKMIVALGYAALSVIVLPLMALFAGTVAFGWHGIRLPGGGETLSAGTALQRMAIVVAYAVLSQLVVAALAFLLSVTTDSPLGAVGGAVGLIIVSTILDAVTTLGGWRDFLPTHWTFAWTDALQPHLELSGMIKGTALSIAYAVVLYALAIRWFRGKDILS
jgi:ABC-type transport system involved in multi-copper enzyme maturation permease subunit